MRTQLRIKPKTNIYLISYVGEKGLVGRFTTSAKGIINKTNIDKVEKMLLDRNKVRCIVTGVYKL